MVASERLAGDSGKIGGKMLSSERLQRKVSWRRSSSWRLSRPLDKVDVAVVELIMRQTCKNNPLLAAIKVRMNARIYARAVEIMNSGTGLSGGEAQVLTYLQQFFNIQISKATFTAENLHFCKLLS